MKKILAFAGSNSSTSVNRKLVEHAKSKTETHGVTLIDLLDYDAPIFSEDLEKEKGVPESIMKLKEIFEEHDAFMIASPEHNGMMPAFFKNIMDWLSRAGGKIFQEKPVLLMSTSPGPRGGQTNLANMKALFPYWGATAVFADFHLGSFYQAYDVERGSFTNPEAEERLQQAVAAYEAFLSNP
jgi:NAD(P)H-dependent FMN reductase